ncbi:hypothetical protein SHIRM173S_12344 [Streptomyces hirsutus]
MSSTRTLVSPAVLARPRGRAIYWTVFTGVVLLFALAFLFPVYWMVTGAMKSPDEVARTPPDLLPDRWSTSGWTDAWELMQLPTHLWNTVVQAAGAWLFQLVFCTAAAYALSRLRPAFGTVVLGGILATLMVPAQALVVPKYLVVADLPLIHTSLLNDPLAIWLPAVANAFNLYLLKRFFDQLPGSSPTSTGRIPRSARSTRTSCVSGSNGAWPVSASTPPPCRPRTPCCRTSSRARVRTRTSTGTSSTTSTGRGGPSPTSTAPCSSARSGCRTRNASRATCAPTNCTRRSTSPS